MPTAIGTLDHALAVPVRTKTGLRWWRRAFWILLVLVSAAVLRFAVFASKPVPVTVYRVAAGRVEETVTNSKAGTVKSRRRAALSPEVGGRVTELPVRKGVHVRRGDLLMRVADTDARAQTLVTASSLDAARSAQTEACRAAELAERDLARNRRLVSQEIVSEELIDQLQSRRDVAAAACRTAASRTRQAEAALAVVRANLEKTALRAPFDGVVLELTTELGEWITPSPPGLPIPPVMVLSDQTETYVSAWMDEVDVARVRVGQPARVTLDAYPGRAAAARVTRVASYVLDAQEQNRTFEVEVEIQDRDFVRALLPGTSADVEIILTEREGVLRIPTSALLEGGRVLVVRDGRLVAQPVRIGLRNWQFSEVSEGLSGGEAVAVSLERVEIKEGAKVAIAGWVEK